MLRRMGWSSTRLVGVSSAALGHAVRNARAFSSASSGLRVLVAKEQDIHFNLATENYLIEQLKPRAPVLFLWRNQKTIVIGRHQNPWQECDLPKMESDGVALARRYSGGGAVYQDLGNTCFTFLGPASSFDKERNNTVILRALRQFGIEGEASGRNDLVLRGSGRKFSGAAFKHIGEASLHHGTVLLHVDLEGLGRYLTPSKLKLQSKGIASVAARVANLQELCPALDHAKLCDALTAEFCLEHGVAPGQVAVESVDKNSELTHTKEFKEHLHTLKDWEWRFGKSPAFSHRLEARFDFGTFDVHLDVKHGSVESCRVFSDSLVPELVDALAAALQGARFDRAELHQRLTDLAGKVPPAQRAQVEQLREWIAEQAVPQH